MDNDAELDSKSGESDSPRHTAPFPHVSPGHPATSALTAGVVTLLLVAALSTHYWLKIAFLVRLYAKYQIPWEVPRSQGFPAYHPLTVICVFIAAAVGNAMTTYMAVQNRIEPGKLWCLIRSGTAMGLTAPAILLVIRISKFGGHDGPMLRSPAFWMSVTTGVVTGVCWRASLDRRSVSRRHSLVDGLLGVVFCIACSCVFSLVECAYLA